MLAAPGKVDHLIATAVADPVVNPLVNPWSTMCKSLQFAPRSAERCIECLRLRSKNS